MKLHLVFASLLMLTSVPFARAQDSPAAAADAASHPKQDWSLPTGGDIHWVRPTLNGVLIAGTEKGLVGLDEASGRELWRIADLRKPDDINVEIQPRPPYAWVRLKKGIRENVIRMVIDVTTGQELWSNGTLGLKEVRGHLCVAPLDAMIVSGKSAQGDIVVAADLATGKPRTPLGVPEKERDSVLEGPMHLDTDSTLVASSNNGLVRYNLVSGASLWRSKKLGDGAGKGCGSALTPATPGQPEKRQDPRPLPGPAPLQVTSDGRRLLAVHGRTVHALDAGDGHPLWSKPPELCGRPVQIVVAPLGALVWTMAEISGTDELVMIDGASGRVAWQYPPAAKKSILKALFAPAVRLSNPVVAGNAVYVLADHDLMRLDLPTGASTKLANLRIDEENIQLWLERRGEELLVLGQQQMEWLDLQGRSLRHLAFRPPDDYGTALLELGTALAASSLPDMHSGSASISFSGDYAPAMESFLRDFHATSAVDSMVFMLADLEGQTTLVAVGKESGRTLERMPVSKAPNYVIDPVNGWVFVLDGKALHAYAL